MSHNTIQRTLLIGLGPIGARIVELTLAGLKLQVGELPVIEGIAVVTEALPAEATLKTIQLPAEALPAAWPPELEHRLSQALRGISHLDHLAGLARQGLSLARPEEVHLVVVGNLAEPWPGPRLPDLVERFRSVGERTLASYLGFTGLFCFTQAEESGEQALASLPAALFERGCFIAGLSNEVGLIIGEAEGLIEKMAHFLSLLVSDEFWTGPQWVEPGASPASFGIAWQRWPGRALLKPLSLAWSRALLDQVTQLPPGAPDPVGQARQAVQQLLTGERLAPPLLADRLSGFLPPLPAALADLVPDPPWPWQLGQAQAEIEAASRRWQEGWLAGSRRLEETLAELRQAWPDQAGGWLSQQVAGLTSGAAPLAHSHAAALTELLLAFGEGVEQKLAESEMDLAQVEQQLGQMAETLANHLADLPATPFRLAWPPRRWLSSWACCRQAQTLLRSFAYLSRARLDIWRQLSLYELLLPFYHHLLNDWRRRLEPWEQGWHQVAEARQALKAGSEPEQLREILQAVTGPWDEGLVMALYQEAVEAADHLIWEQVGTPLAWVEAGLEAETLLQRLRQQTGQALATRLLLPVDQFLRRQWPAENTQAAWLAGLAEQARPFWPYDETRLAETLRTRQRLEYWLFLPGGESSPLAQAGWEALSPLTIRPSHEPETLVLISTRQLKLNDDQIFP